MEKSILSFKNTRDTGIKRFIFKKVGTRKHTRDEGNEDLDAVSQNPEKGRRWVQKSYNDSG